MYYFILDLFVFLRLNLLKLALYFRISFFYFRADYDEKPEVPDKREKKRSGRKAKKRMGGGHSYRSYRGGHSYRDHSYRRSYDRRSREWG